MERTADQLRRFLAALPASGYDIGILSERGKFRLEAITANRILRMLPYLQHRNATGAHIYLRPTGESAYTLLDDLTRSTLPRLAAEGFAPAGVVETSPGSFQAWLRHAQPRSKELGTLAAKLLAARWRGHQCRRLAQVRTLSRFYQPQVAAPQCSGLLSIRTAALRPRPALPCR